MVDPSAPDNEFDPFFIGWLGIPRSYVRLMVPVVGGAVLAAVLVAGLIAAGQQSPGNGEWGDDRLVTFEGIVYADPYAMIRVPSSEAGGTTQTILLVEEGKRGAQGRVRPHDGRPVHVRGTLLGRDGRQMLELVPGEGGFRSTELPDADVARLSRSSPHAQGRVTLRGEIVDAKCYLGAMKPGGGKTHKGCAVLCLRGGIPPIFVTRDATGATHLYLLAGSDGGSIDDSLLDHVGEPVELDGHIEQQDDLSVLTTSGRDIRRQ